MSYRKHGNVRRSTILDVSGIIAKADKARDEPPTLPQQSYAGWEWDGDTDPYLQTES